MIDQNCASLPIPKLFSKVGNPQILIHKLDSTPAYSTDMPRWDCFWCQGLGEGLQGGYDTHLKPPGATNISPRGMRIDTYCWIEKVGFSVKFYLWHVLFLTVFAFGLLLFFRILISILNRKRYWFKIQKTSSESQTPPEFHPKILICQMIFWSINQNDSWFIERSILETLTCAFGHSTQNIWIPEDLLQYGGKRF